MLSAVDQAWEHAFAAEDSDLGPWRVLVDALLDAGDPQGEFIQLELDAEQGTLRGLARGRLLEVRRTLMPRLTPAGVTPENAVFRRGVLTECTLFPSRSSGRGDAHWKTVRRLRFLPESRPPPRAVWAQTPLASSRLPWLVELSGIEHEALDVILGAAPLPALRRLRLMGDIGRPPGTSTPRWALWWEQLFPRQPLLREVHFGWSGMHAVTVARLESALPTPLERVLVEAGPFEVVELCAWALQAQPRFEFVAELRQTELQAAVVLHPQPLLLRCPPVHRAEAEQQIRSNWPAHRQMPPLRFEPR